MAKQGYDRSLWGARAKVQDLRNILESDGEELA